MGFLLLPESAGSLEEVRGPLLNEPRVISECHCGSGERVGEPVGALRERAAVAPKE